jgi:hypothetical protein
VQKTAQESGNVSFASGVTFAIAVDAQCKYPRRFSDAEISPQPVLKNQEKGAK